MRFAFYAGRALVRVLRSFFSGCVISAPCVLCAAPAGSISLCRECRCMLNEEAEKAIHDEHRCTKCGRPLISEHDICTSCRELPLFEGIDGVFPLFPYVLSKKKLLYSWKIGKQHNLTEVYASYLAEVITVKFPDAAVVPVPPRPGKIKKTGWDQIEDVSQYLEHIHHIHVMRILCRTESVQQKKLSREERSIHSGHAYILNEKAVEKMKGKIPEHVVLLDDVITTGNTVKSCASVLKATYFIKKVSVASLFIVPG